MLICHQITWQMRLWKRCPSRIQSLNGVGHSSHHWPKETIAQQVLWGLQHFLHMKEDILSLKLQTTLAISFCQVESLKAELEAFCEEEAAFSRAFAADKCSNALSL